MSKQGVEPWTNFVSCPVHKYYITSLNTPKRSCADRLKYKANSRKYQGVFKVKSRVKTWQVRGIWSQQFEHTQVPKKGTEQGVQKFKLSLLACHTRCKCSMETTHNSVKVNLGMKVMKLVESLIGWEVTVGNWCNEKNKHLMHLC